MTEYTDMILSTWEAIVAFLAANPHLLLLGVIAAIIAFFAMIAATAPVDPNPELSRLDLMDRGER